jgi:hypothetical protein
MAINVQIPVSLFDKLNQLDDTLYLTGSRFFGYAQNHSDYDFFAAYSEELSLKLKSLEFKKISGTSYKDLVCVEVLRAFDYNGIQIDIQLVSNVNQKDKIQKLFKEIGLTHPTKEQWNLAIQLDTAQFGMARAVELVS